MTTKRSIGQEGASRDASHVGASAGTPAHDYGVTVGDGTVADETVPTTVEVAVTFPAVRASWAFTAPWSAFGVGRMSRVIHGEIVPQEGSRTQAVTIPAAKVNATACLCVECGEVSNTPNDCPLCGSKAMLNLARILDRPA